MADISSYLAAIMAAVYGEDVRGSIHDAIDIINKVGEVVLNTGTAVTGPTSSSTGFYDGSFYINTNTMELWKCIGTNAWQSQGVLKGGDGADGNGIVSIVKTATVGLVDTYTITFDDGSTETYQITNGQNGSKWYKGTAISGTGTSITGFPGTKDDYYLNSVDGYVYVCTKTGGAMLPDAAEWDYVMTLTGGGGGSSVTVIDNLTSTSSTDALSANQGRVLKGLVDSKASDTQTFTEASTRANLVSGETLSTLFGKLMKWYTDLKSVAFSGSYTDLTNQPTIPAAANDGTLTIQQNGTNVQTFTADQSGNATANIVTDEWTGTYQTLDGTTAVFSNLNDAYGYDLYCENKLVGISNIAKTGSGTSTTLTYTVTGASIGDVFKLRILK